MKRGGCYSSLCKRRSRVIKIRRREKRVNGGGREGVNKMSTERGIKTKEGGKKGGGKRVVRKEMCLNNK